MNNRKVKITAEEWVKFGNSKIGRQLLEDMETLKNANLNQAMDIPDKTIMPNESIAAYMNRAKGVQIVIDNIVSNIENAKSALDGGKKSRD